MAKKLWAGTSQTNATTTAGDYSVADNWTPISIRTSAYAWTLSGSGTGEYYLRTAALGNPSILQPGNVQQLVAGVRTNLTAGTLGSLAVSGWGYGNNDALGYSTIYVRLSGGGDPDSQDLNHVTYTAIPQTADDVRIPATTATNISSGLVQNAVAIGDFIVEKGYRGLIGSVTGKLFIDPDRFEFAGEGPENWIDIGSAAIPCRIITTGRGNQGKKSLYLTGTAITYLDVESGSVALAGRHGDVSTATTVRVLGEGADVLLGEGCTITTFRQLKGTSVIQCAGTTLGVYGGQCRTEEEGAWTTVNIDGGEFTSNSIGTITTLNGTGGRADFTQSGAPRTITTLNREYGFSIKYDPNFITITNRAAPAKPISESYAAI